MISFDKWFNAYFDGDPLALASELEDFRVFDEYEGDIRLREINIEDDSGYLTQDFREAALNLFKEDIEREFNKIIRHFEQVRFPLVLYRGISLDVSQGEGIDNLFRDGHVGIYWTEDKRKAAVYEGRQDLPKYVLVTEVLKDKINWKETILARINPIHGHESEVQLKYGVPLIVSVEPDDKLLGEFEVMARDIKANVYSHGEIPFTIYHPYDLSEVVDREYDDGWRVEIWGFGREVGAVMVYPDGTVESEYWDKQGEAYYLGDFDDPQEAFDVLMETVEEVEEIDPEYIRKWRVESRKKVARYVYETSCVDADCGEDIEKMVEHPLEREVSYEEMLKHVPELANWARDMGYGPNMGLEIWDDYAVSFHKSVYKGHPAYYVDHSAIEYIWIDPDEIVDPVEEFPYVELEGWTVPEVNDGDLVYRREEDEDFEVIFWDSMHGATAYYWSRQDAPVKYFTFKWLDKDRIKEVLDEAERLFLDYD